MYKPDLALDNLQPLICHKTKPNLTDSLQHWSHVVTAMFSVVISHNSHATTFSLM